MGKRSNVERVERDFYPTPFEAVVPLFRHLTPGTRFTEPCCGDGALIRHLESVGHRCMSASDLHPVNPAYGDSFGQRDAMAITYVVGECFITNPPWRRDVLHPLIVHLSNIAPTWLLFDADWMHTRQAAPYMGRLRQIVSVGRVKWIEGSKNTGKDNCCWYLFDNSFSGVKPQFYGRT